MISLLTSFLRFPDNSRRNGMRASRPHTIPSFCVRPSHITEGGNILYERSIPKEQDLPLAERWLENYLLTRKQADSRQLLHTTRLTDLIYQGFAAQQPINRFSSDRNTPDMESLAKDLFAALYSPILRRKDEDSVKLKERMLSKPLFEKNCRKRLF